MAFVEDFRPLLAEFGVDGTLDGVPVRVIFDNPYAEALQGIATRMPTAGLPSAQATGVTQQSLLVLPGVGTFRVRSPEPDGTGWTTLMLEQRP